MIDVKVPLIANRDAVNLHLMAKIGSDVIHDAPGHSLTRGFVEALRRFFYRDDYYMPFPYEIPGQTEFQNLGIQDSGDNQELFWIDSNESELADITGVADNGSGLIRITHASSFTNSTDKIVYISGVGGVLGVNGFWKITNVSSTTSDLQGSTWPGGTFVSEGAKIRGTVRSGPNSSSQNILRSGYNDIETTQAAGFLIGRDSTPVTVGDNWLGDLIFNGAARGMLRYGAPTRTAPAVVGAQTEITETRAFVNENPTYTVVIRELGLCSAFGNDSFENKTHYLLARDIVNIELTPTNSVAITYRIRTQTPASGGFTRQFLELFYRNWAGVSREVKDILNANWTNDFSTEQMALGGRVQSPDATVTLPFASQLMHGIVVGTSTKDCEPDDYKLRNADDTDSIIIHGTGAGQMFYNAGTTVEPVAIVGSKASFQLVRMFENRSGADVTVNEVGIYCRNSNSASISSINGGGGNPPICIARHKITPTVVPNGQVLRVSYEIGAETV